MFHTWHRKKKKSRVGVDSSPSPRPVLAVSANAGAGDARVKTDPAWGRAANRGSIVSSTETEIEANL